MDAIEARKICDDASTYEIGKAWKQVFGKTLAKAKMNGAISILMKELGTKKLAHTFIAFREKEIVIDIPEEKFEEATDLQL